MAERDNQGGWEMAYNKQINKYTEDNESQIFHSWKGTYKHGKDTVWLEKTLRYYIRIEDISLK